MADDEYVLYWNHKTSAIVPHVMLLELGVPFELVRIDTSTNEHKQAHYLEVNRNGLLPALQLPDGTTFGETAAILIALGDRHLESGFAPSIHDKDRAKFLQWLIAIATTGHTTMRRHCYPDQYTTRHDALDGTNEVSTGQLAYFFEVFETAIEGSPYFLERGFGPIDIYLSMLLKFFDGREALFEKRTAIADIYEASTSRPSFEEVFSLHFSD